MKRILIALMTLLAIVPVMGSITLFDVDFESPTHTVGSAPTTGSSINTPSSHNGFGWTIQENVADFSSQVAVVGGDGYEWLGFNPSNTVDTGIASIVWELAILETGTDPQANITLFPTDGTYPVSIVFDADGDILVYDPVSGDSTVSTWTLNKSALYSLILDLDTRTYDFFIDSDQYIFGQSYGLDTDIDRVTFFRPFGSPSYAIDNFSWTVVPEPSTIMLWTIGGLLLAIRRKRQ